MTIKLFQLLAVLTIIVTAMFTLVKVASGASAAIPEGRVVATYAKGYPPGLYAFDDPVRKVTCYVADGTSCVNWAP